MVSALIVAGALLSCAAGKPRAKMNSYFALDALQARRSGTATWAVAA
jgi:hypothetical protein